MFEESLKKKISIIGQQAKQFFVILNIVEEFIKRQNPEEDIIKYLEKKILETNSLILKKYNQITKLEEFNMDLNLKFSPFLNKLNELILSFQEELETKKIIENISNYKTKFVELSDLFQSEFKEELN